MSFDLVVLAGDPDATDAEVRAMAHRCQSLNHPEGELDERIVGFYENLRARYPDSPPYDQDCPWMVMPLNVGIDHVSIHLSWGKHSDPALLLVLELAQRYGLTIHDLQGDQATRPPDMEPAIRGLIEKLRPPPGH